jgi:uncharacterized RDD family membrane protein YckC
MSLDRPRFPKVPLERRAYAFLIDFTTVWLLSSFAGPVFQWLIFLAAWFGLRVIAMEKNQGQSLGYWALDMKVIDAKFNRIPGLLELSKREGIIGFAALLAMFGLNINFANALSMLLLITPLLVDCGLALGDEELNQAFHDRIAGTIVIQTRRGFSLDLRVKKWGRELQQKLRR